MIAILAALPFYVIGCWIFFKAPRTFWWWLALAMAIGLGSMLGHAIEVGHK